MKVIDMKEAHDWLMKTSSEDTLVLAKNTYTDNEYDNHITHQYEFMAMLESKEEGEEYPHAMAIDFFGNSGWALTEDEMSDCFVDVPLVDKIVDECGHRCGDMYIDGGENVVGRYVDYAENKSAVFILGADSEIRQILPYLVDGMYCFLFEKENAYTDAVTPNVPCRTSTTTLGNSSNENNTE